MSEATQIVAIDGPVGTGKSSVAKQAARELGLAFLDTGAMYRAATWWALDQGVDLEDPVAVAESVRSLKLDMRGVGDAQHVLVNGTDVTDAIRTPELTRLIYKLDQNSEVRRHLVALQRLLGEARPTVAEGRDIGTVVFPKAKCKIYLDASLDVRTARRARQLEEKGVPVDWEPLRAEVAQRDEQAMTRKDSPLRRAGDALYLDTSTLSFEEVVGEVVRLARERL